jgi:hypothetical protein
MVFYIPTGTLQPAMDASIFFITLYLLVKLKLI